MICRVSCICYPVSAVIAHLVEHLRGKSVNQIQFWPGSTQPFIPLWSLKWVPASWGKVKDHWSQRCVVGIGVLSTPSILLVANEKGVYRWSPSIDEHFTFQNFGLPTCCLLHSWWPIFLLLLCFIEKKVQMWPFRNGLHHEKRQNWCCMSTLILDADKNCLAIQVSKTTSILKYHFFLCLTSCHSKQILTNYHHCCWS